MVCLARQLVYILVAFWSETAGAERAARLRCVKGTGRWYTKPAFTWGCVRGTYTPDVVRTPVFGDGPPYPKLLIPRIHL